jgi:hypothetical protein
MEHPAQHLCQVKLRCDGARNLQKKIALAYWVIGWCQHVIILTHDNLAKGTPSAFLLPFLQDSLP